MLATFRTPFPHEQVARVLEKDYTTARERRNVAGLVSTNCSRGLCNPSVEKGENINFISSQWPRNEFSHVSMFARLQRHSSAHHEFDGDALVCVDGYQS